MTKTFARGFAAVILLGALSGLIGERSASASTCQPLGPALLCYNRAGGLEVILFSDAAEVHSSVLYSSIRETGIIIGDGLTNQSSGAFVSCDPAKNKYRLTYGVIGSFKNRSLGVPC